jgi:phospholipase C
MPTLRPVASTLAAILAAAFLLPGGPARADAGSTRSPIEHVIVVVGENHTFDNVFGAWKPKHGQQVANLLSRGIVKADGTPGPNFHLAAQSIADGGSVYSLDPVRTGKYATLPRPNNTYATGRPYNQPDDRFPADLPNGPFQISKYAATAAFVGDPPHRFFQMWQEISKGRHDLFVWTPVTAGIGNYNANFGTLADDTFLGGLAMGFYNMEAGDLPDFKRLAETYASSDNYHQSIMGGTGANFIALVTGDAAYYNARGLRGPGVVPYPVPLPAFATGTTGAYTTTTVENPNPDPVARAKYGNTNWFTDDGYAGGSYVKCADPAQPGVASIQGYLASLDVAHRCEPDTYYLVNNFNPLLNKDGTPPTPAQFGANPFRLPTQPPSFRTIADSLQESRIGWKYYSGNRTDGNQYCAICDPLTHFGSVMFDPAKRSRLVDLNDFFTDLKDPAAFPAVAFVRPWEDLAGHPANSSVAAYEAFVVQLVEAVKANPSLWEKTAILVTVDEGGGYYDSGYVQPVDFFGDGTRVPLLAISPWARPGHVDHAYGDHASVLKFIEWNWRLSPISVRSRDGLPNPLVDDDDAYVPVNGPALTDLTGLFDFEHHGHNRD